MGRKKSQTRSSSSSAPLSTSDGAARPSQQTKVTSTNYFDSDFGDGNDVLLEGSGGGGGGGTSGGNSKKTMNLKRLFSRSKSRGRSGSRKGQRDGAFPRAISRSRSRSKSRSGVRPVRLDSEDDVFAAASADKGEGDGEGVEVVGRDENGFIITSSALNDSINDMARKKHMSDDSGSGKKPPTAAKDGTGRSRSPFRIPAAMRRSRSRNARPGVNSSPVASAGTVSASQSSPPSAAGEDSFPFDPYGGGGGDGGGADSTDNPTKAAARAAAQAVEQIAVGRVNDNGDPAEDEEGWGMSADLFGEPDYRAAVPNTSGFHDAVERRGGDDGDADDGDQQTTPSPEELQDMQLGILRSLSREAVKEQGNILAKMQREAQETERLARSRSLEETGGGGGGGGVTTVDLGGDLAGPIPTRSRSASLSPAAQKAADAAADMMGVGMDNAWPPAGSNEKDKSHLPAHRGGTAPVSALRDSSGAGYNDGEAASSNHARSRSKVRFPDDVPPIPDDADGIFNSDDPFLDPVEPGESSGNKAGGGGAFSIATKLSDQLAVSKSRRQRSQDKGGVHAEVDRHKLVRSALTRPITSRSHLPAHLALRYEVQVGQPVWDADVRRYKYGVKVAHAGDSDGLSPASAFPPASSLRSLSDFVWLEQSLRAEFAGAFLPPLLGVALHGGEVLELSPPDGDGGSTTTNSIISKDSFGSVLTKRPPIRTVSDLAGRCNSRLDADMDANVTVNHEILAEWLSDVLNGIRGSGEFLLPFPPLSAPDGAALGVGGTIANAEPYKGDVTSSEAMEAFLFKNIDNMIPNKLLTESGQSSPLHRGVLSPDGSVSEGRMSCLAFGCTPDENDASTVGSADNGKSSRASNSILDSFLSRPLGCFDGRQSIVECGPGGSKSPGIHVQLPVEMISCSSPSGAGAKARSTSRAAANLTLRSPLLEAERDLLTCHRRLTTRAIHRLKVLRADETRMSTSWKRLAICLSNLFAFEKDVENARVGVRSPSKSDRKKQPYRKLSKNSVDDGLRILARQKVERAMPGLVVVADMLGSYLADLVAVDPCLIEYAQALEAVRGGGTMSRLMNSASVTAVGCASQVGAANERDGTWSQSSTKAMAALRNAAKQITGEKDVTANGVSAPRSNAAIASTNNRAARDRISRNGMWLEASLASLCRSSSIRSARSAFGFFKAETTQAAHLSSAAMSFRAKLTVADVTGALAERDKRHNREEKEDNVTELGVVRRMLELAAPADEDDDREFREELCNRVLLLASERVGRWDSNLALAIMEAAGVEDAEVQVEETTRDLRLVRKYAIGLRENVERCEEAVGMLNAVVLGAVDESDAQSLRSNQSQRSNQSNVSNASSYEALKINRKRELFLSAFARVLSSALLLTEAQSGSQHQQQQHNMKAALVLAKAGVDTSDPAGWLAASDIIESDRQSQQGSSGKCGEMTVSYQRVRDNDAAVLLARINQLLADYQKRVEGIESFVYMHCVGIQLEKHYSRNRSEALAAWEKKTDITTAINIATKKRLPLLVQELQAKLETLPPTISHTSVKQAKEKHLASKTLKEDLQKLADRRFQRAKESATERVITIMRMWAQHEELVASEELKVLGELLREVERNVDEAVVEADGGAHLHSAQIKR